MSQIIKIGNKLARIGANVLKYTPPTITPNGLLNELQMYYTFDNTLSDSTGNFTDCNSSTFSYNSGKINDGIFMSDTSESPTATGSVDMSNKSGITYSVWIKNLDIGNNYSLELNDSNLGGSFIHFERAFDPGSGLNDPNELGYGFYGTEYASGQLVPTGLEYKHYVIIYDNINGGLSGFTNGIITMNYSHSSGLLDTDFSNFDSITWKQSGTNSTIEIDEQCFWTRPLTQDDVALLYNSGLGIGYSDFTT